MAAISLRGLTKVYATGVRALDGLDLEVSDGEFVVLVGPSGCGKTTALRMVAGLERITSGTVSFGDRVVNDVSPRHRDVAMVFQNYALYPHLSVYQNIGFALENKKIEKTEGDRQIRSAAEALGLGDLLGRKPAQLSGGQRQRVAMGRALVRSPMNLYEAGLSTDGTAGTTPTVVLGSQRLTLPPQVAARVAAYQGRKVIVGVRPEDLAVSGTGLRGPRRPRRPRRPRGPRGWSRTCASSRCWAASSTSTSPSTRRRRPARRARRPRWTRRRGRASSRAAPRTAWPG